MRPKVSNFTVSYSFDVKGRSKSSHFVSTNFTYPEPVSLEDMELDRLEVSSRITIWAIQDAVMRGDMGSEEAKERVDFLKASYEGMKTAILRKKGQ